jgi:hypothetical protein
MVPRVFDIVISLMRSAFSEAARLGGLGAITRPCVVDTHPGVVHYHGCSAVAGLAAVFWINLFPQGFVPTRRDFIAAILHSLLGLCYHCSGARNDVAILDDQLGQNRWCDALDLVFASSHHRQPSGRCGLGRRACRSRGVLFTTSSTSGRAHPQAGARDGTTPLGTARTRRGCAHRMVSGICLESLLGDLNTYSRLNTRPDRIS